MNHPHLQDDRIKAILAQPFGRFSDGEFARRRQGLTKVAEKHECDAILLCGEERSGTGVGWLTGWPTSAKAIALFAPGERDVALELLVEVLPGHRHGGSTRTCP